MKELVIRATQLPGGLWELALEGTVYRAGGGTLSEAFAKLLEVMFEEALRVATRELE